MNRENAKKLLLNLDIVRAFAEGKVVEFNSFGEWEVGNDLFFTSTPTKYRIKPEPRKVWIIEFSDGSLLNHDEPTYSPIYGVVKKMHGPFEL